MDEIDEGEMLRLLLDAAPELRFALLQLMHEHTAEGDTRIDLIFPALADLMLDMLLADNDEALRRVCNVIERLNRDGNAAVQRYATLHLLDALQQAYTPSGGALGEWFQPYLGFVSGARWQRLRQLRAGEITEADVLGFDET